MGISFQLMVEASPTALILVNSYGKIAYVNKYFENLFLYDRNELIGQDLSILIPDRFKFNHPNLIKNFFKPSKQTNGENRELYALKKNGIEFPVEIGLNPIVSVEGTLVLAAIIDISDRKKANKQFQLVVESSPNAMILVDHRGFIVMINKQTEKLFGYERNELIGKNMEILVPEKLRKNHSHLRKTFYKNPQTRSMGVGRDLYTVKKDGSEIPIEIGLTLIPSDDNNYVLATIIDITERKKTERKLKSYNRQLNNKNKELEQFTYITSHDLQEPLNSIISWSSLLKRNEYNKLNDVGNQSIEIIEKSAIRMKGFITSLLEYSKVGREKEKSEVNIKELIKNLEIDLSDIILKENAKIKFLGKDISLFAYKNSLTKLFQNIITNSIKYKKNNINPNIKINVEELTKYYKFSISDNGIGIEEEYYDKVFEIFQRLHTRDKYEGTGIGLSHCKRVVEMHKGNIWIESEIGKGTTFYFTISK